MSPKKVSEELRKVQARYKDEVTSTFEVRVSDMAKEAADAIDELLLEIEQNKIKSLEVGQEVSIMIPGYSNQNKILDFRISNISAVATKDPKMFDDLTCKLILDGFLIS